MLACYKVNQYLLWLKLKDKVGDKITRSLMNYYDCSYDVKEDETSNRFKTTIGIKQGGPLSPKLFAIYIEDLIKHVEDSNIGIKIAKMKIQTLLYTDDIIVISNTKLSMQKLAKHEIKFNPTKSAYLEIKSRNSQIDTTILELDGAIIEKVKYLGNIINEKLSNCDRINNRIKLTFTAITNLNEAGYSSPFIRANT